MRGRECEAADSNSLSMQIGHRILLEQSVNPLSFEIFWRISEKPLTKMELQPRTKNDKLVYDYVSLSISFYLL